MSVALLVLAACAGAAAPTPTPPPTSAPTETPAAATAAVEPLAGIRIDASLGKSTVTVRVRETLAQIQAPSDAVLTTSALTGQILLATDGSLADGSRVTVDLTTLRSDQSRRDNFIKDNTLETRRFPRADFVIKRATGLPAPLPLTGEWRVTLIGDLTLHGVTKELSWEGTVKRSGADVTGTATTKFTFGQFGMERPVVGSVLSIVDEIRLEVDFVGTASG